MSVSSPIADEQLASQEGLCCMQLSQKALWKAASLISIEHIQKLRHNFSRKVQKLYMDPVLHGKYSRLRSLDLDDD
jgi:hypothetical protein